MIRQTMIAVLLVSIAAAVHGQERQRKRIAREPDGSAPAVRRELLAMEKVDQDARAHFLKLLGERGIGPQKGDPQFKDPALIKLVVEQTKKLAEIDRNHTARLARIIDTYGWPGEALVGARGTEAVWLLVQHADANVTFQKHCLRRMKAAPKGDVKPRHIAYLTDRILVHEGKMQVYGTQIQDRGGVLKPLPIADEINVDKRRAEAGMEPLAKYLKTLHHENEKLSGARARRRGKN